MIELLDGPCRGSYTVRRAPVYLRAVVDAAGAVDVLDQLDDAPRDGETVHVYQREPGTWGHVFACPGGCYEMGQYRHLADVDGDQLRDTDSWQAWAHAQDPELHRLERIREEGERG